MKKRFREQLKKAFDAPAQTPNQTKKTEFIQSINFPKTNRFDFILGQIGYIRKRVWIISCLLLIAALVCLWFFNSDSINNSLDFIWIISSFIPFISLITVTEITRSTSYNMAELEMSCKYNFADIVLARLGILSFFNMAVFGVIILSFISEISKINKIGEVNLSVFIAGIYMLVPFMLTCSLSLFAVNRLRSRETTYICGGISCFIGIANSIFTSFINQHKTAFSDDYLSLWSLTFIILIIWTVHEVTKLVKKTEEIQWNLL